MSVGYPILAVEGLRKEFEGRAVVENLTFSVSPGEILGLLGVNGAGKTTAMNMVLGLIEPTAGSIHAFGLTMPRDRIAILRRANFCSSYASLPSNLLVEQNLQVFARLYGVKNASERIEELLKLLEIGHLRRRVTGHLSAGESTRLSLCKAMINRPELLMLDEPTASLDPDIADKVRRTLREVQRTEGMAMLYTSHNMRDIEEVCDRVIFIHHGKVIAEGTPDEVVRGSADPSLEHMFIRLARESGEEVQ
ncbi:MAG: ABC transporter ATP-binding protein [Chthoniobacterales bacterium]